MKILHISDTHGHHERLTTLVPADVIVHSGDITENGTSDEIIDFIQWFEDLDYAYKIFIPGNHDLDLYDSQIEGLVENMFFLKNEAVCINGVKFYGLPYFTEDVKQNRYTSLIENIPEDTDVLISHEPPLGILDDLGKYQGNLQLLKRVYEVKPKLHLFGHVHNKNGIEKIDGITFSNAAMENCNSQTKMHLFEID